MLKHIRASALVLIASLALCESALAFNVDMPWGGPTDPWQLVPMPNNTVFPSGSGYLHWIDTTTGLPDKSWLSQPAMIAMPDGSFWTSGKDGGTPILHFAPNWFGPPDVLPPLASGARPGSWARAADGTLWFTEVTDHGQGVPVIGRLDPATKVVTELGGLLAGAQPAGIVTGPDGNLWFVDPGANAIGRITPAGVVTEFQPPANLHLTVGWALTVGPSSDLYFLVHGGIARMTTSGTFVGGVIDGGMEDFEPRDLAYGRDGNLWTIECNPDSLARVSPSGTVTRSRDGTFAVGACPTSIVSTSDGTVWLMDYNDSRYGHVVFDSPLATTDDPTGVGSTTASFNGEGSPRGSQATIHFEYGTSTGYGRTTGERPIGDQDGAVPVSESITGLRPSTTYHYRLVVTNPIGTVYGADQTVTTVPEPPPPPPPLPVDRDGDDYASTVDCDDQSAAIHPGALDKPDDGVDQDCSGADSSHPRFQPHADAGWRTVKGRIVFTRMIIDAMPAGSSLKLTCRGSGCTKRPYTATMAKPIRRLDLTKRLKNARLRKGDKVELTLSRPGYVTTIVRWTIGPPPRAAILCLPPDAMLPRAC